jgi:hypothetical protein
LSSTRYVRLLPVLWWIFWWNHSIEISSVTLQSSNRNWPHSGHSSLLINVTISSFDCNGTISFSVFENARQKVSIGVDAFQFFNSNERMCEGVANDDQDKLHLNATYKIKCSLSWLVTTMFPSETTGEIEVYFKVFEFF